MHDKDLIGISKIPNNNTIWHLEQEETRMEENSGNYKQLNATHVQLWPIEEYDYMWEIWLEEKHNLKYKIEH